MPTSTLLEEVQALVRAVDPSALLVPARLLRRIITHHRCLVGFGRGVPHAKSYLLSREELLNHVTPEELPLVPGQELAPRVLLLEAPDHEDFATRTRSVVLLGLWRRLFHLHIHLALEQLQAEGRFSESVVRQRIEQLGPTEFAAAREVLHEEAYLLPPRDLRADYVELAAVFLELRAFAPELLPSTFPGLADRADVEVYLMEDLDIPGLLERTQLPGAAARPVSQPQSEPEIPGLPSIEPLPQPVSDDPDRRRGNSVRAALRRQRAGDVLGARAELALLAERLRPLLELSNEATLAWRLALESVLAATVQRKGSRASRMLFDLQKVCVDAERDLYAADLLRWALTLGRHPIKRLLPDQREVSLLQHLRRAARRIRTLNISGSNKKKLAKLINSAIDLRATHLRARFRPKLLGALDTVGIIPENRPEEVARNKLVESLLDRIIDRGFISMGDLRDGLSGGPLKLPDLEGIGEFLFGDRLLRVNQVLAKTLEGVYRPGEIYLRLLQRLSALAFGTPLGRILVLFLVIPIGGAFAGLVGLDAMAHEATVLASRITGVGESEEEVEHAATALLTPVNVTLASIFLFSLLHFVAFRKWVWFVLKKTFQYFKAILIDIPEAIIQWEPLRKILYSRVVLNLGHYLIKPAIPAILAAMVAARLHASVDVILELSGAFFVLGSLILATRLGSTAEESFREGIDYIWHRIGSEILPAVIRWIIDLFRAIVETFDRLMYAIDELLRFRAGQSQLSFVLKASAGLLWFFVAYFLRMNVILWIEPTVNPIKHFPTVTVAAKLLLPILPILFEALEPMLGTVVAGAVNTVFLVVVPGLAGFAVWELKENWRLYAVQRERTLGPVLVGSHGETMVRLFRPGIHSGTVPRLFARLRRAERRARKGENPEPIRIHRAALDHVEESVRHFVQRDFLSLLNGCSFGKMAPVVLGEVDLESNRIRLELRAPHWGVPGTWLSFEDRDGWLVGNLSGGWIDRLSPEECAILTLALAGLYKFAGVALVRAQIESLLPSGVAAYDLGGRCLVVWGADRGREASYSLVEDAPPHMPLGPFPTPLPQIPVAALCFDQREIPWEWWVQAWQEVAQGKPPPSLPFSGWTLF